MTPSSSQFAGYLFFVVKITITTLVCHSISQFQFSKLTTQYYFNILWVMQKAYIIILLICLFICRNAFSYDECFKGSCYSHLNDGWTVQGGIGCIKTGLKWKQKYNHSGDLKKMSRYAYIAVNTDSSAVCNSPSVLSMEMLAFHNSSQTLARFKGAVKKAINWCWLATNNKLKFSRKNISDAFLTDNNLEVKLFLYSDGSIEKTFVRMETTGAYDNSLYWVHLNRQDLARLKNEISALERLLLN